MPRADPQVFLLFVNSERKLTSLSTVCFLLMMRNTKQLKKELKNLTKESESLRSKKADKSHRAISPSSVDVQHLSGTYDGSSTTMKSLQTILNVLGPVKFNPGMSQILSKVF